MALGTSKRCKYTKNPAHYSSGGREGNQLGPGTVHT
jgi:hypothetical protein